MLKKVDWSGLRNLIVAKSSVGTLPPIAEYTETGNPATFETGIARALTKFEIPLLPVQSGSGVPSPDNVRPISGWSGVTVTANGQTILAAWESVAGVVYGGTVDLVSGEMTVTHYAISGDAPGLILERDGITDEVVVGKIILETNKFPKAYSNTSFISNRFSNNIPSGTPGRFVGTTIQFWFAMPRQDFDDATDANAIKQWLVNHPTIWVYKMATSQTVQLTPVEIKTIIGQNSIATATGGTNTIKYLKRG